MSEITIVLDNSLNSAATNPPGYFQWVGGRQPGDPAGTKVDKTDSSLTFKIAADLAYLPTWHYNLGWHSGVNVEGPFADGQVILLKRIS
jgi:hypothetical protein